VPDRDDEIRRLQEAQRQAEERAREEREKERDRKAQDPKGPGEDETYDTARRDDS
jgi:hypothetical protein